MNMPGASGLRLAFISPPAAPWFWALTWATDSATLLWKSGPSGPRPERKKEKGL